MKRIDDELASRGRRRVDLAKHLDTSVATVGNWALPDRRVPAERYRAIAAYFGWSEVATPETHVRCPDCRELVRMDARKCKHCGCTLTPMA